MCHKTNDREDDKPSKYTGGAVCACHYDSVPAMKRKTRRERRNAKWANIFVVTSRVFKYLKHRNMNMKTVQWCQSTSRTRSRDEEAILQRLLALIWVVILKHCLNSFELKWSLEHKNLITIESNWIFCLLNVCQLCHRVMTWKAFNKTSNFYHHLYCNWILKHFIGLSVTSLW